MGLKCPKKGLMDASEASISTFVCFPKDTNKYEFQSIISSLRESGNIRKSRKQFHKRHLTIFPIFSIIFILG